jgi:hypothetical protein
MFPWSDLRAVIPPSLTPLKEHERHIIAALSLSLLPPKEASDMRCHNYSGGYRVFRFAECRLLDFARSDEWVMLRGPGV